MSADTLESTQFYNGITEEWTLRFVWPEKPWTANEAISQGSWRSRATKIKYWREAFAAMAAGCDRLEWCDVTVDHVVSTRRAVDVCAPFPSVKAAIDGITLAGVLDDDGPDYVRSVMFNAATYEKGVDALIITMTGPAA